MMYSYSITILLIFPYTIIGTSTQIIKDDQIKIFFSCLVKITDFHPNKYNLIGNNFKLG